MTQCHCCMRPKANGNSASGQQQHGGCDSFDCCTERYEIVVLLTKSELSLQMVIISVMLMTVWSVYDRRPWLERLFKLLITSLFVVRNIKCGYSFS